MKSNAFMGGNGALDLWRYEAAFIPQLYWNRERVSWTTPGLGDVPAEGRPGFLGQVRLAQNPKFVFAPVWSGPYPLVLGPSSWGFGIGYWPPTAVAAPVQWPSTVQAPPF